ncbi:S9 family peptidase [Alteromonadaceae bacterium BrNp21-10]|nr:S9 family peptidase [Alteromonadaceae bacterium BrNp21-10]
MADAISLHKSLRNIRILKVDLYKLFYAFLIRTFMPRFITTLYLLLCIFSSYAELLPVDAFGKLPNAQSVKLSPNGKQIAFIRNVDGSSLIGVTDLIVAKTNYILKTDNEKFKIGWFVWANDNLLLVSSDYPVFSHGAAYTESRLLKLNPKGEDGTLSPVIAPKIGTYNQKKEHIAQFQNNIIDMMPEDPDHIMMAVDFDIPTKPSVYLVDLSKKTTRSLVLSGKANVNGWLTDQQHRVRLGFGRDDTKIFYRLFDLASESWRTIWEYEIFDAPDITPLGFGLDPNILYIIADHEGRYALFKVDVSKPELPRELVISDEKHDIEGPLIYSNITHDIVGVHHTGSEGGKIFFDKSYTEFQDKLNKALPNSFNNVVSYSANERKYILYNSSSTTPGAYFVGDKDQKTMDFLLEEYPMLFEKPLSGKQKVTYKARDGLKIEGYLTRAQGGIKQNSPAIILPHGGPLARDYANFDWLAEFFANRGYTVLQPNFRGSSGYGFAFEMKAIQNYGGTMQDDLQDAANWLSENYPIDKNKICIVGASYGGYAALMAAATQQETFKCAASFAGMADLELSLRKLMNFTNYKVAKKQFGDDLEGKSPINLAKNITIPVLLLHGDKDRVVSVEQSRKMESELRSYEKDVTYIEFENGNHHLEIEAHRLATLRALEGFLHKHIGATLPIADNSGG